jgi:transcriptional regulator with XRE-family HTH domain
MGASRTIAELLFAKRTELDLNQADMARTLGVSQANYSRWETSQSVPATAPSSMDELGKLVEFHRQGILTDTEFAAQKAKLLG